MPSKKLRIWPILGLSVAFMALKYQMMTFPRVLGPSSHKKSKFVEKFYLSRYLALIVPRIFKVGLFGLFKTRKVAYGHFWIGTAHCDMNSGSKTFWTIFPKTSHSVTVHLKIQLPQFLQSIFMLSSKYATQVGQILRDTQHRLFCPGSYYTSAFWSETFTIFWLTSSPEAKVPFSKDSPCSPLRTISPVVI